MAHTQTIKKKIKSIENQLQRTSNPSKKKTT